MIAIGLLPCLDCINCVAIEQPSGDEMTEFIHCKKAKSKNANELLVRKNNTSTCNFMEEAYEEI